MFEDMKKAMGEAPVEGRSDTQAVPDEGTTDPGPTPARNVRIPDSQWEAARRYGKAHGLSVGAVIRMALAEWLNHV